MAEKRERTVSEKQALQAVLGDPSLLEVLTSAEIAVVQRRVDCGCGKILPRWEAIMQVHAEHKDVVGLSKIIELHDQGVGKLRLGSRRPSR